MIEEKQEQQEKQKEMQSATVDPHIDRESGSEPAVSDERAASYWQANLKLLAVLLSIWFVVSFGCGILFVDALNQFSLFGFKLGFWFAQQGSIVVFLLLIVIYAIQMRRIERHHGVED